MKAATMVVMVSLCACVEDTDPATATDSSDDDPTEPGDVQKHVMPVKDAIPEVVYASNGITYHGGSVMTGTSNTIYYIWYGSWTSTAKTILTDLAENIGGSPYFNINTTYTNKSGTHISNAVKYGGETTVGYTHGKSLDDSAVQAIVDDAVTSGALPKNTHGIYFVLTSKDVNETSGFCSQYCGWHYFGNIDGSKLKYAFIGSADRCLSSCAPQSKSPNGNAGADAMASIIAHELEETVTDPLISAWYDAQHEENGDKCAWTFGSESTASNGSKYNMTLGSRHFLIQQNWVNANGGSCKKSL
jgi:Phosphate-induced protein 1 conserved region